jgi:hypothetical protein
MDNTVAHVQRPSRTALQTDGGQLAYHPRRDSGIPPRVFTIARDSVRELWNGHTEAPSRPRWQIVKHQILD